VCLLAVNFRSHKHVDVFSQTVTLLFSIRNITLCALFWLDLTLNMLPTRGTLRTNTDSTKLKRVQRKYRKNMTVVWVIVPCSLVGVYRRFRGACSLRREGDYKAETTQKIFLHVAVRTSNLSPSHTHTHTHTNTQNISSPLLHWTFNYIQYFCDDNILDCLNLRNCMPGHAGHSGDSFLINACNGCICCPDVLETVGSLAGNRNRFQSFQTVLQDVLLL
jgi:hypothetical protein